MTYHSQNTFPERAAELLLAWYDIHKRRMPWRDICDPYATWVS